MAVLCLRKDALVGLYDKGHSVLFKPSVGILRAKLLEKALEQFRTARVYLTKVCDLGEGVGAVATASSRYLYFLQRTVLLLKDGDV